MLRHTPAPGARLRVFVSLLLFAACLAPASRADALAMNEVGINSHLLRHEDYAAACDEILASGIKSVRLSFEWGELQDSSTPLPQGADHVLLDRLDDVVFRLWDSQPEERRVQILMQLHYGADWCSSAPAGTPGRRFYPPARVNGLDAWADYVTFLAEEFDGRIKHWEVWNEPDSNVFLRIHAPQPTDPDYADRYVSRVEAYHLLLARAYDALKDVNSANQVLLGGLVMPKENPQATNSSKPYMQVDFLDQLLARPGAKTKFDIMNYHAYGDAVSQREKYLSVQAVLAKHGIQDRKIWLTETGYSTSGNTALEAVKADRVTQHWLSHMSYPNIEKIFWYLDRNVVLPDDPPPPAAPIPLEQRLSEENFGLRANDRTPLMPWFHYQALNGGLVDFKLQTAFPAIAATQRSVTYLSPASGNGSQVTNYLPDGSSKRIALGTYLYFQVNDQWIHNANDGLDDSVEVTVSVLNNAPLLPNGAPGSSGFLIHYDGRDGAYVQSDIKYRTSGGGYSEHTFTLPNILFTNRQNHGADFRLFAGSTADLVVNSVVVRRRSDSARLRLGATDRFFLMDRVHSDDPAALNYNPATTFNGEAGRQIPLGKYMFFRVSDAWVRTGDTRVRLNIRFWDDGVPGPENAPRNLVVEYNALGGLTAKAVGIRKSATPGWRDAELTLEDADFRNAGSFEQNDFRIRTGGNGPVAEHISHVEVIPLTLLPTDDFEDGDSAGWTTLGNTWSVLTETGGNRVLHQSQTSSGETIAFTGQASWNDYDFAADVKIHHASAAGLVARYTDVNNYYVFAISTGQNRIYLKKRVAGLTSSLVDIPWTGPGAPFTANTTYRLRLVLNGPRITAFVGDTQVADLYDASLSTGRVGVRAVNASYSADNVAVY